MGSRHRSRPKRRGFARCRWLGALIPVLVLLAAPPTATGASRAKPTIVPATLHLSGLDPSAANPLRVWILGDSVMHDGAPPLTAALAATGEGEVVADSSFGGWGLTRVPAWAADSEQIIAAFHPQVIIGTWSWDDTLAQNDPAGYVALLRRALGVWLAPGDGVSLVALVQFPQIGPNAFIAQASLRARLWSALTTEQRAWNTEAAQVVQDFPGRAVYFTTDQIFAPQGRFLTWASTGGHEVRVRQVDNIHLCPFGAIELTQVIVGDLAGVLGLAPPAAGWQSGPWTADRRYAVGVAGPGACPNDPPLPGYRGLLVPTASGR